jgi:uncharacterized protein (TIGR02118 family)
MREDVMISTSGLTNEAIRLPPAAVRVSRINSSIGGVRMSVGLPWAGLIEAAADRRSNAGPSGAAVATADHGDLPGGILAQPMIKIMFLLVKRQDMTEQQFHRYWLQRHAPIVSARSGDMGMRRYVQSHLIPSPMTAGLERARGWRPNPFQGVAEVWWDSEEAMAAVFATPQGADAGEKLAEDEKQFLDDRTVVLMTREYLIFDQ